MAKWSVRSPKTLAARIVLHYQSNRTEKRKSPSKTRLKGPPRPHFPFHHHPNPFPFKNPTKKTQTKKKKKKKKNRVWRDIRSLNVSFTDCKDGLGNIHVRTPSSIIATISQ